MLIAPFLLRMALAFALFEYCYRTLKKNKISVSTVWGLIQNNWLKGVIISQLIIATMLVLGLFTQAMAILAIISLVAKEIVLKKQKEKCSENSMLILFVAICLSLLVLGPGIFSLDLPL